MRIFGMIIYIYIYILYITPIKAWRNVDLAGSILYTWNDCEQEKMNVDWEKRSLVYANGVTILGKSKICF